MGDNRHLLEVLTLEQAARFLKLTSKEVAELAKQGRVPGQLIGKKWRFLKNALAEWLRKGNPHLSAWSQFGVFANDATMPELRRIIEKNKRRLDAEVG